MALIVKKFGGSSVATTEKIMNVAKRVLKEKQPGDKIVMVVSAMGKTTDHLIDLAKGINKEPYQYSREMDMLLTTGEQVSIALLAMAFQTLGQPAISLTGPMAGMKTNDVYTKGRIMDITPERVHAELDKGQIVVVAGFQGRNELGDPVTLGRGGSDTSAVALAGCGLVGCRLLRVERGKEKGKGDTCGMGRISWLKQEKGKKQLKILW